MSYYIFSLVHCSRNTIHQEPNTSYSVSSLYWLHGFSNPFANSISFSTLNPYSPFLTVTKQNNFVSIIQKFTAEISTLHTKPTGKILFEHTLYRHSIDIIYECGWVIIGLHMYGGKKVLCIYLCKRCYI